MNVDLFALLGPLDFLHVIWVQVCGGSITELDVVVWPESVSVLCRFSAFLSSLHWPADAGDLGHLMAFRLWNC